MWNSKKANNWSFCTSLLSRFSTYTFLNVTPKKIKSKILKLFLLHNKWSFSLSISPLYVNKSTGHSSTRLQFYVLVTIKKLMFTLTIHPHYHFRPALPLLRNQPIDLLCKWFLYNGNTANLRHNLFHILFSTFLKIFTTHFPKYST